MRKRDFLKKKAIQTGDTLIWQQYKYSRNRLNNEIKKVKSQYFTDNLEANKKNQNSTWKLITELNFRNASGHKTISSIKVGEETINTPEDMAQIFNLHFASKAEKLASDIPPSPVEPDIYVEPADTTFSMKSPSV